MEYLKVKINTKGDTYADKRTIKRLCEISDEFYIHYMDGEANEVDTIVMYPSDTTYYNYLSEVLKIDNVRDITTKTINEATAKEYQYNYIVNVCDDCNNFIIEGEGDTYETASGDIICEQCYNDNYFVCEDCGEIYHVDNRYYANDDREICDNCYNDNYFTCDDCGYIYHCDYDHETYNGDHVCDSCYNNDYFTCDDCGEVYHIDDMNSNDNGYYCNDCYASHCDDDDCDLDNLFTSYHDSAHDRGEFFGNILKVSDEAAAAIDSKFENDDDHTIGMELETERSGSSTPRHLYCETLNNTINKPIKHIMFEDDSSLDCGVEIITKPMTLLYWEKEKDGIFKQLLDCCQSMNYTSHKSGKCGLHVHFNKKMLGATEAEQEAKIDTMLLFFETYKDEIKQLSRRNDFYFCDFLSNKGRLSTIQDERLRKTLTKSVNVLSRAKYKTGHHDAINANASTGKTFEIRIFRGTLKHESFAASVEFCINLIKCIANEPQSEISFTKVVNYLPTKYLKNYIKERDIKANYKKLKDYTQAAQKAAETIERTIRKADNDIIKTIKKDIQQRLQQCKELANNYTIDIYNKNNSTLEMQSDAIHYNNTNTRYLLNALHYIQHDHDYKSARSVINYDYTIRTAYDRSEYDTINKKIGDIINNVEMIELIGG